MLMDVGCQMQSYKFDSIWQIALYHQDFNIIIVQRNLWTQNRNQADLESTSIIDSLIKFIVPDYWEYIGVFLIRFIYPKQLIGKVMIPFVGVFHFLISKNWLHEFWYKALFSVTSNWLNSVATNVIINLYWKTRQRLCVEWECKFFITLFCTGCINP